MKLFHADAFITGHTSTRRVARFTYLKYPRALRLVMGEIRDCPSPFCDARYEYPGGPDTCPTCNFPVEEWWTMRSRLSEGNATGKGASD